MLSASALKALILNNNEISTIEGLSSLSKLNSLGELLFHYQINSCCMHDFCFKDISNNNYLNICIT